MKHITLLLCLLVLLTACSGQSPRKEICPGCCEEEYLTSSCPCCNIQICGHCFEYTDEEYKNQRQHGYENGIDEGYDIGYAEGFEKGYSVVINSMSDDMLHTWWEENPDVVIEYQIES